MSVFVRCDAGPVGPPFSASRAEPTQTPCLSRVVPAPVPAAVNIEEQVPSRLHPGVSTRAISGDFDSAECSGPKCRKPGRAGSAGDPSGQGGLKAGAKVSGDGASLSGFPSCLVPAFVDSAVGRKQSQILFRPASGQHACRPVVSFTPCAVANFRAAGIPLFPKRFHVPRIAALVVNIRGRRLSDFADFSQLLYGKILPSG
jgi:hypothetical protein